MFEVHLLYEYYTDFIDLTQISSCFLSSCFCLTSVHVFLSCQRTRRLYNHSDVTFRSCWGIMGAAHLYITVSTAHHRKHGACPGAQDLFLPASFHSLHHARLFQGLEFKKSHSSSATPRVSNSNSHSFIVRKRVYYT